MRVIINEILLYYKVDFNGKEVETYKVNVQTEDNKQNIQYICRHYEEPKIVVGDIVEYGKVVGHLVADAEMQAEQMALF